MGINISAEGRPRREESASKLRKLYTTQISHLLRNVEGRNPIDFRRGGDPMDTFLPWLETTLKEKQSLEDQIILQTKAYNAAQDKIGQLEKELETAQSEARKQYAENKTLKKEHGDEKEDLQRQHAQVMDDTIRGHNKTLEYRNAVHKKNVDLLEQDKQKLVGQLLVNRDDNEGWPDDKLKVKFRELQRVIESITSPRNKEFRIPQNQQLGLQLDPTNFLSQAGSGKSHFLLKSTLGSIIIDQFFSVPFGFGAFGPGNGRRELIDIYSTWQRLSGNPAGTGSANDDYFTTFSRDKLANNWRSATFQCINATLTTKDGSHRMSNTTLAKLSAENVKKTVERIMGVLSELARLSNTFVRNEIQEEIYSLANLAHRIALQFGVHPALLQLKIPRPGEQIQIGDDFHDCADGDVNRGSVHSVGLVVVPGLQKIGNGRSDMNTRRSIVPCEIYPG